MIHRKSLKQEEDNNKVSVSHTLPADCFVGSWWVNT